MPAVAAAQPQEAVGQDAAFEKGVELVLHELRQFGTSGASGPRNKARIAENLADRRVVGSVIVNEGNSRFFEPAPGRGWLLSVRYSAPF